MINNEYKGISFAILAAALYAISAPFSKLLLNKIPATLMTALLYLGTGVGMALIYYIKKIKYNSEVEFDLTKQELPYIVSMVILDIAAGIFLMVGLNMATPENVSLLNNFEIVATSIIAFLIFNEPINKRLWIAIIFITTASIILSVEDMSSFSFSLGSIFILLACVCWGLENNITRKMSVKNPIQIVVVKGLGTGFGSLIIGFLLHERISNIPYIIAALILGFFSYGISICFYIYAQRYLGAARTSAYYAISPFIGVLVSFIIFREIPNLSFFISLIIMIIGTYFASTHTKSNSL